MLTLSIIGATNIVPAPIMPSEREWLLAIWEDFK